MSVEPNSNTAPDGVTTRGMTAVAENMPPRRAPRMKFPMVILPRLTTDPLAANNLCYVLHPDQGSTVVAEGRTGGSWKCRSGKFGKLCSEGQQMVRIHKVLVPNLPLIFIEDRQPFSLLDHALVKASGSNVYIKWQTRLLLKKKKTSVPKVTV